MTPEAIELLARRATLPLEMLSPPLMLSVLLTVSEPPPTMEREVAVRVPPLSKTSVAAALVTVTIPAFTPPASTVAVAPLVKLAAAPLTKMAELPLVSAQSPELV